MYSKLKDTDIMNAHSKHSAQASISLYSMRGKSWSFYQKHVSNLIDFDLDNTTVLPSRTTADVQRLDLRDCNLFGVSPCDPGPMVLCNQCNHIMAPEGIMRHVKRVHGSKIVPSPSIKLRIPAKGSSTVGSILLNTTTSNINRIKNSNSNSTVTSQTAASVAVAAAAAAAAAESSLSTEFTNRLNVSKMAPPTPINASTELINSINNNSSSSNSNSPISLSKISSTSTSVSGSGSLNNSRSKNRKVLPIKDREYDPEKHCGVRIGNMKPCTRSLTCKTHQISLRRNVDGRSKPFDQLLADHRNNAKETHKHSSSKQANYLLGDNSNQQLLESIGDSNSSSSFDMERRSFSSNSNQSTIGNYNSDHSTAFSTSSAQQFNGTNSLPSVLSSITSSAIATTSNANASNFAYADGHSSTSSIGGNAMVSGTMADAVHRKSSMASLPFTPSPDDRSSNASQLGDLYNSSTLSAMQSSAHSTSNLGNNNHLNSSALNTSATLASLGDYSMQMNDLINDDNGDGLDMTFWENFDNFNYDADLVMSNNNSNSNSSNAQQYPPLLSKSTIGKRSYDGLTSERKRKRGINDSLKGSSSMHSKSIPKDLLAKSNSSNSVSPAPIPMDIALSSSPPPPPSSSSLKSTAAATTNLSQSKKSSINATANAATIAPPPHNSSSSIVIDLDESKSEVICIEDDEDDATNNNNIDATVNRNSDRENGTIYPVTPTKELNSDFSSTKHHMNRRRHRSDSVTVNGTQSPPLSIDRPLATMTLSTDTVVKSTDIINVTKILSEVDHQSSACVPPIQASTTNHLNETGETNDGGKSQSNQLASVPLGENENFLLDMVYKCLRGKGVRVINSNYSNNNNISNNNGSTTKSMTNDSNRIREKENSLENHWSDDEILAEPIKAANNPIMPTLPRFATSKCAYVPRAVAANNFNMARGRGTCHIKHTVDYTKKIQQQIFHRIQTQQNNGTFTNANMITLRNNGLLRLNSANLNISNIGTITTASINTTGTNVNTIKTTTVATTAGTGSATAVPVATATVAPTTAAAPVVMAGAGTVTATVTAVNVPTTSIAAAAAVINATTSGNNSTNPNSPSINANANANANVNASPTATPPPPPSPTTITTTTAPATATATPTATKLAFKKPVHFVNSISTTTNGPIVLLNPGNAATMSSAPGNPRYTIFRRPMAQSSIQFIARPTIDPTNSYALMPAIHRVKARAFKPTVPKFLETDRLIESLKSIMRPQAIDNSTYNIAKKVLSVHNQTLNKLLAHQQSNHHSNSSTNNNLSSMSSSSSKRKSHSSSLSNHKSSSSSSHASHSMTTSSSSSSQKQNGHSHSSSNGAISTSGSNYVGSNSSANSTSNATNHIDKRTHLRIANDASHK